jgi:hypothetical protein
VHVTNLAIVAYRGTSEYPNINVTETALIRLHDTALIFCGHISTFKCDNKSIFNVYWSVHRNNILVYKSQQDAQVTEFILFDNFSTSFGRHYYPSSGAQHTQTGSNSSMITADNNTM